MKKESQKRLHIGTSCARQGKEIFCYFDDDEAGYAAQDAGNLQQMIKG